MLAHVATCRSASWPAAGAAAAAPSDARLAAGPRRQGAGRLGLTLEDSDAMVNWADLREAKMINPAPGFWPMSAP